MMKFWWVRWAGYVACMGEKEWIYDFGRKDKRKETIRRTMT
jgi:hypothetical protein